MEAEFKKALEFVQKASSSSSSSSSSLSNDTKLTFYALFKQVDSLSSSLSAFVVVVDSFVDSFVRVLGVCRLVTARVKIRRPLA